MKGSCLEKASAAPRVLKIPMLPRSVKGPMPGERLSTRFAPGYFQMMADFFRDGRISEHYGKAEITPSPRIDHRKT